jgi:peptide/nickel transport system permease protein
MSQAALHAGELDAIELSDRRRRHVSPVIVCAFVVAGAFLVLAIFGHLIAPQDPNAQDLVTGLSKPSGAHWFGTDQLGRDIFSRVLVGARPALVGPIVVAAGSMLIGNMLGLLAGYRGGSVDGTIMRWVDFMYALPALLVIIVVAGALGGGYWLAVALLLVLTIPFDTRIVRGATLEQASLPYVEAARTLGLSQRRIMLFHIWPNVSPIAVANSFLVFASSLVALAGLSFLGLGAPPGTADWGLMVSEGQSLLFANPVGVLAPAVAIALVATSMNLIGDWIYEKLSTRGATR